MRDRLVHRGPDDEGLFVAPERARGPRVPPAEDHRSVRRGESADAERGRHRPGRLQRRDLQLPRARAPSSKGRAIVSGRTPTPKSSSICTRSVARPSSRRSTACLPSPCGTSERAASCSRATAPARSRCSTIATGGVSYSGPRSRRCSPTRTCRCGSTSRRFPASSCTATFSIRDTLYHGVRQVDPATAIGCRARRPAGRADVLAPRVPGGVRVAPRQPARKGANGVRQLVTEAVARRLVSDVPLGAFLSGGIDSTVVVGLMSRLTSEPVKTFSIGFEGDAAYDETAAARRVAERFGTDHTEFRVRPSAVELVDRLIWHHDGPFGDSSAIPTYLVSELTRQHVTVVLTGDGGDEVFAGYLRFAAALAAERCRGRSDRCCAPGSRRCRRRPTNGICFARARRFAKFMNAPLLERARPLEQPVPGRCRTRSCSRTCCARLPGPRLPPPNRRRPGFPLSTRCSPPILRPICRAICWSRPTAARWRILSKPGVRCSTPRSLEYVAGLPDAWKLDGRRTKAILRDAFADLIPSEVDRRPKTGFGVPLDAWFRGELRDYARDTLLAIVGQVENVPQG